MMRKQGNLFVSGLRRMLALCMLCMGAAGLAHAQDGQDVVYRITVTDGINEATARDYKNELENAGFLPVNLDFEENPVTVRYGNFSTQEEALEAKARLEAAGFGAREIVQVSRGGGQTSPSSDAFRVRVATFTDSEPAGALETELENKGFVYVDSIFTNGRWEVMAGRYDNRNDAQNLIAILRDDGYTDAELVDPSRREVVLGQDMPAPEGITPMITDTGLWRELSEDQKRRVLETVLLQEQIRSGDAVAQKIIDLERRIESLDEKSRQMVQMIQSDRESQSAKTRQIGTLFRDAENLARGKQYDKALIKFRQILQIDPNNQTALRRIALIENFLKKGERYEGQSEELQARYAQLKQDAERLTGTGELANLREARSLWKMVQSLDPTNPERFSEEATAKITALNNRIQEIEAQERQVAAAAAAEERRQILYLYGAIGLLVLVIAVVAFVSRRRHQKLVADIQAVTAGGMRPMRELEGSGAAGNIGQSAPVGALAAGAAAGGAAAGAAATSPADDEKPSRGGFFKRKPKAKAADADSSADEEEVDDEGLGDPIAMQAAAGGAAAAGADDDIFGEASSDASAGGEAPAASEDEHGPVTMSMGMDSQGSPPATEDSSFTEMFEAEQQAEDQSQLEEEPTGPPPAPAPPQPEPQPEPAATGAEGESSFDDIFSDLPSLEDSSSPVKEESSANVEGSSAGSGVDLEMDDLFGSDQTGGGLDEPDNTGSAISFDDIMAADTHGGEGGDQSKPAAAQSAPEAEAPAEPEPPADSADEDQFSAAPQATSAEDPFAGTPFEDIFGETTSEGPEEPEPAGASEADQPAASGSSNNVSPQPEAEPEEAPVATETRERPGDDTEIPSLDVEIPGEDPFASPRQTIAEPEAEQAAPEAEPEPAAAEASAQDDGSGIQFEGEDPFAGLGFDETIPEDQTAESPQVETGAPGAAASAAGAAAGAAAPKVASGDDPTNVPPPTAGGAQVVFSQDFAQAAVGSQPEGWNGSYDYAKLSVQEADPPAGAKRYMAYSKPEGAGKAYYSCKFPNTAGVLSVEFDLRCNDKNKFLLGFYIEKDEDFQQSVHTKILRSESQTAPTIHIHGEPAPYMLGSWAHIRYVIDLNAGQVDGYIDGTRIAKGIRIPQSPKFLNTLAIRDNINTTGELWLANIKVEKIG